MADNGDVQFDGTPAPPLSDRDAWRQRVALRLPEVDHHPHRLKPGKHTEYETVHATIPTELDAAQASRTQWRPGAPRCAVPS